MTKYKLLFAAPLMLSASVSAQSSPADPQIFVYEPAPGGLGRDDASEWAKLNEKAAALSHDLAELLTEQRDDHHDVAEAQSKLNHAQNKLDTEQADLNRTNDDIAEVESEMRRITALRAVISNR